MTTYIEHLHLATTSRHRRLSALKKQTGQYYARVKRGVTWRIDPSATQSETWKIRNDAALARISATCLTHPHATFIGPSAALLHGLWCWDRSPDVHILTHGRPGNESPTLPRIEIRCGHPRRSPIGASRISIPAARIMRHQVPAVGPIRTVRIRGSSIDRGRESDVSGSRRRMLLRVATLEDTLILCALTMPASHAFVTLCDGMRRLSHFNKHHQDRSRKAEERVRAALVRQLSRFPRGHRNVARARWLIQHADAGCESIGEAMLLWIVRSRKLHAVRTQFEVRQRPAESLAGARPASVYFIDIAFPREKVALEFDGRSKRGVSHSQIAHSYQSEGRRQRDLEARGWVFERFIWDDLHHPEHSAARIEARLRGTRVESADRRIGSPNRRGRPRAPARDRCQRVECRCPECGALLNVLAS